MITVAAPPPQHRPDVAVDGFGFPEENLLVAVVQDADQMLHHQAGELLEGRHALPNRVIDGQAYGQRNSRL